MWFKLICTSSFLVVTQLIFAQEVEFNCYIKNPKGIPRERTTDFKKVTIDIAIDPYSKTVSGKVDFQFEVIRPTVDSIWLDAPGITINHVALNEEDVDFRTYPKGVSIYPKKPLEWDVEYRLTVNYQAIPRKGMYFVGWNSPDTTAPKQVWTQGQGVDNRYWYPHFDNLSDKLITETKITFENGFDVLSNGQLINKEVSDSATTWHYSMLKPHSSYLVMIAIGDYEVDTIHSASGVAIHNWYYHNQPEKKAPTYYKTAELMDFLSSYTGVDYPWGDYAQVPVHNFLYGAMENTSATIFSDKFQVDSIEFHSNNYVFVNAHEMAHQWFGNLITSRSPEGHWIHEGFATYFHGLWQGEVFGEEAGSLLFESFKEQAIAAGTSNQLPISHADAGSARHYMKAATVIRMLRDEVGEETFKRVLTHFLEKYAYQNVTSEDFLMAFHDVAGYSLEWFFDQWVMLGGEPHFQITMMRQFNGERGIFLKVDQTNADEIGRKSLHLPVSIMTKRGQIEQQLLWIDQDTIVKLSSDKLKQLNSVVLDPEKHLLMTYELINWPSFWFLGQMDIEYPVLSRKEAVDSLIARNKLDDKQLMTSLLSESSDYVGSAYVRGFSDDVPLNKELLSKVKTEDIPLTKQALSTKLNEEDELFEDILLTLLADKNNNVVEMAMIQVANNSWYSYIDFSRLHQRVKTQPSLRLTYIQLKLLQGNLRQSILELTELTQAKYDVSVRIQAFDLLAQIDYIDADIATSFYEAGTSFNRNLRNSSRPILMRFTKSKVMEAVELIDNQEVRDWIEKEIEIN